ncbi:hypothetical protein ASG40_10385 [Methylobacterium sp. Leaf399]|nr:hypothetical protein ASG40_10385 [Methylobacterium sp. Leaf399]
MRAATTARFCFTMRSRAPTTAPPAARTVQTPGFSPGARDRPASAREPRRATGPVAVAHAAFTAARAATSSTPARRSL